MFIVPALWFTALTLWLWQRHKGYDVCVYMSSLYALVSIFAAIIVLCDMMGEGGILFFNNDAEFGVVPTLLYCTMITLTLLPFHLLYDKDIKRVTTASPLLLDGLGALLILVSILNVYLVADSTMDILSGDLSAVRDSVYLGEATPAQIKAETMPFYARFLYYFNVSTLLALPLLFYNLCFRSKPWWWNLLLFFASLCMPIAGIQAADRTEFIYYALMLLFTIILFRKHISRKVKWIMGIIGTPMVLLGVIYVVAVSESRFSETEGGSSAKNFQYAGQGYINFCYFWEHGNFDKVAAEREFPLVNHYFYHIDSNAERRNERMGQQGFFISVFATFLGDIMLDLTPLGMVLWACYYFLLAMLLLRRSHREEFDISEMLLIFLMACIPVFGIFYYRFFAFTYSFAIVLALAFYLLSILRIRL